jgi:hypothetical protein
VLLHNKHPLKILEQCARLTKETVVVVEVDRETQPGASAGATGSVACRVSTRHS